jgi:mRNA interferase MazF
MARFRKGDVVVVRFPFADLQGESVRPAVVVATLETGDYITCQVTSQAKSDNYSISLADSDFSVGKLTRQSFARPNRLFTCAPSVIKGKVGTLRPKCIATISEAIIAILHA